MNKRVLFIGGSTCSGRSTVAERISKEYDARYHIIKSANGFHLP